MSEDIQQAVSSENISPPSHKMRENKSGFLFFFGIILPAAAVITVIISDAGSEVIPTIWHICLIAIVPIANFLSWYAIRYNKINWLSWLGFVNGITLCISGIYVVSLLPMVFFGIISVLFIFGVIFYGIGFILISPISAFISALIFSSHLKLIAASEGRKFIVWHGIVVVLCILGLFEIHSQITIRGMNMAASVNPGQAYQRS